MSSPLTGILLAAWILAVVNFGMHRAQKHEEGERYFIYFISWALILIPFMVSQFVFS